MYASLVASRNGDSNTQYSASNLLKSKIYLCINSSSIKSYLKHLETIVQCTIFEAIFQKYFYELLAWRLSLLAESVISEWFHFVAPSAIKLIFPFKSRSARFVSS